jgi:GxxExxY protein
MDAKNPFFEKIATAAEEVYRVLGGPGLLENIYEGALSHELILQGFSVQRQVPIPVIYKNVPIREPLFLDLLVDDQLIIEIKANGCDYPYYEAQLMTHMRLLKKSFGMLINFGKIDMKKAIRMFSV